MNDDKFISNFIISNFETIPDFDGNAEVLKFKAMLSIAISLKRIADKLDKEL